MLRLALAGCGSHAETTHGPALRQYVTQHPGEAELVAACDLNVERARRFCDRFGFATAYADIEVMLAAEAPDAVVCIMPVEKIAEVGTWLLGRRIPCVLEKPLGRSREETRSLIEAARQTGTPHMVSVNRRFSPCLARAVAWARGVGPLRYIRGQMFRHARREQDFIWGTAIHAVDAIRHIGGDVASIDVRVPGRSAVSARAFLISLRFASGCEGSIEVLPDAGMVEETYELFGDGFRARAIMLGRPAESVQCWKDGKLEMDWSANPDDPMYLRDGSYEETCAFIRCLREGAPLRPTIEDVAPSMEICWQIAEKREALTDGSA